MNLRQRLDRLKGHGAGTPAREREPDGRVSVAERVQRLRPRREAHRPVQADADQALADRLGAELLEPGVLGCSQYLPLENTHGRFPLSTLLGEQVHLPEARGWEPHGLVFLDTETTGLAGGTGTAVFMLGLARLEGHQLHVRQFMLTRFAGEAGMLRQAADFLAGAHTVVTYNGKRFDLPLLLTRVRLAGLDDPFSRLGHLDLLYPVRRLFRQRWPDCRLITAEQRLLGFRRLHDLPGAEAPLAWLDYLRDGEARRLPGVLTHNRWDLVSLAALYPALDRAHGTPDTFGADPVAVAKGHLKAGRQGRALEVLHQGRAALDEKGLLLMADLLRRDGRNAEALHLWDALSARGCVTALEALAKYHEHVRRDLRAALECARGLPAGEAHQRRRERLMNKLALRAGRRSEDP
ncbi:ribonuclease H-like domain-containing protein [Ectothiorhodospira variabilis]|uniref:ribonuclease H-like domain-containing protein n=1 Tax=Ectothiorhodospira variabilis TaxID=505694 RepID=UPI001EFA5107|nr:ribonuclease H-like domain-containing protein [Ectothiorhodospira variabilis]MCG5497814.1 ribonuclease H-like domain-containing protein [Ectothiorhodospira variabilis]MCG5503922.1 ribonuclease H-like domain-containing protein [Ectothiorhodospira variabilis]MCG5507077.1 ribonuclease H-like domain-containing protein [Ectothiorhodospira variabilis]